MKKDLKTDILATAKVLFNQQGYQAVSLRDIAKALNISVGNLTYHFKRKEDLIEAVILEQHKGYQPTPPPQTLEELEGFFRHVLKHQCKNAYYFRNYTQLAQISSRIYQMQQKAIEDMRRTFSVGLNNLWQAGLLQPEQLPRQQENLVQALMTICIYGGALEQHRRACMWSLIYPLLTPAGRQIYHTEIESGLHQGICPPAECPHQQAATANGQMQTATYRQL